MPTELLNKVIASKPDFSEKKLAAMKACLSVPVEPPLPCEDGRAVSKMRASFSATLVGLETSKNTGYPLLDPRCLEWENKKGWPQFALIDAFHESGEFEITSFQHDFTGPYERYTKFCDKLRAKWHLRSKIGVFGCGSIVALAAILGTALHPAWFTVLFLAIPIGAVCSEMGTTCYSLKAKFSGFIPKEARAAARKAHNQSLRVFLLCEIPDWKPESETHMDLDPLIVGYQNGNYFLCGSFDTTPAEEYLKQEFAI